MDPIWVIIRSKRPSAFHGLRANLTPDLRGGGSRQFSPRYSAIRLLTAFHMADGWGVCRQAPGPDAATGGPQGPAAKCHTAPNHANGNTRLLAASRAHERMDKTTTHMQLKMCLPGFVLQLNLLDSIRKNNNIDGLRRTP